VDLSEEQRIDFDRALEAARLIDLEVDPERRRVTLTLDVLALPLGDEPTSSELPVAITLHPVGRIAASLMIDDWRDPELVPFEIDQLPERAASFGGLDIIGWGGRFGDFLDIREDDTAAFAGWKDQLSLDWRAGPAGVSHTLEISQEEIDRRHLHIRFWFDEIAIAGPDGDEIPFDEFTAAGARWWEGLWAGDPRTKGHGIYVFPPAPPREPTARRRRRPPPRAGVPMPAKVAPVSTWARLRTRVRALRRMLGGA
jgi:hypothetical protein